MERDGQAQIRIFDFLPHLAQLKSSPVDMAIEIQHHILHEDDPLLRRMTLISPLSSKSELVVPDSLVLAPYS